FLVYLLCSFSLPYRSHRVLLSFPTRRSSDLLGLGRDGGLIGRGVSGLGGGHRVPSSGGAPRGAPSHSGDQSSRLGSRLLTLPARSEEHTSELQSRFDLVCRLLLEKKNPTVII